MRAKELGYRSQSEIDRAAGTNPARPIVQVFADGGTIGSNPSEIGLVYAYAIRFRLPHSSEWVMLDTKGGVVVGEGLTNNVAEMVAITNALALTQTILEARDQLQLYSDSAVTLQRLFNGASTKNLPLFAWQGMVSAQELFSQLSQVGWCLLDGHPTRDHLIEGVGKSGRPVHQLQDECHRICKSTANHITAKIKERFGWS